MSDSTLSDAPVIFLGIPRSGTTMLGQLANTYLDIGAANEGQFEVFLDRAIADDAQLQDDAFFDRILNGLVEDEYFSLVFLNRVSKDELRSRIEQHIETRSLNGIAMAVLKMTAEHMQLPRPGHEDPQLIDHLPALLRVFPDCRIVHTIRDPRDVALSILKFPWGANNVTVAADHWARRVGELRQLGGQLGTKRYFELTYEQLLVKARRTMGCLMTFATGKIDAERLDQYVAETEINPRRNNSKKWATAFSKRDLERIEGCAAEQMTAVGYELATDAPPVSTLTRRIWKLRHRVSQVAQIARGQIQASGRAHVELKPAT
jgi:hypothetical protein